MKHQYSWIVLGAALLALAPRLEADSFRFDCGFTNLSLIPGIKYSLDFRVLDQANALASNRFTTLRMTSASGDISFDPAEMDILAGKTAGSVILKIVSPVDRSSIVISDTMGLVSNCTLIVEAADPESLAQSGLVLNEIMYATDQEFDEWVEFYNASAQAVTITNFIIVTTDSTNPNKNEKFKITNSPPSIPEGSYTVAQGGYLIAVRDLSRFQRDYPDVFDAIRLQQGSFAGSLIVETWKPAYSSSSPNYDMGSTGDTVYLKSGTGYSNLIQSLVCYQDSWGGQDGYSLQRLSASASAFSPGNWSSSSAKGGTPGSPNAGTVTYPAPRAEITLSTNVVDPDFSILTLTVEAAEDYRDAIIDIVSTTGRTVRTLAEVPAFTKGEKLDLTFDGKDQNAGLLPVGLYFVRLTVYPSAGGRRSTTVKAFVISRGFR